MPLRIWLCAMSLLVCSPLLPQAHAFGEQLPSDSSQALGVDTPCTESLASLSDIRAVPLADSGFSVEIPSEEMSSLFPKNSIPNSKKAFAAVSERLLLAPTGFSLGKGRSEYRNVMFLHNNFQYGISDHLTAGAGITSLLFFGNYAHAHVKYTVDVGDQVHLAAGGIALGGLLTDFGIESDGCHETNHRVGIALAFSSLTIGSNDYFLNLSALGPIWCNQDCTDSWMFSIGSSFRLGRKLLLVLEVLKFESYDSGWLPSANLRVAGLHDYHFDFATIINLENGGRPIPIFGVAKRFGTRGR